MSRVVKGREAVIVSTARTPLAKSWKGALNMTHGATMGAHVIKAAIERAGIDPASIDDVIMGLRKPGRRDGPQHCATGCVTRRVARQCAGADSGSVLFIWTAGHRARRSASHR